VSIGAEVLERPHIALAFTSWLIMFALAVTSTTGMIRRLGGKRWQALHRLVYVAAIAGVVHYWWSVKADVRDPRAYAVELGAFAGIPRSRLNSKTRDRAALYAMWGRTRRLVTSISSHTSAATSPSNSGPRGIGAPPTSVTLRAESVSRSACNPRRPRSRDGTAAVIATIFPSSSS
jgi:Ferric reductase like transmembrane component